MKYQHRIVAAALCTLLIAAAGSQNPNFPIPVVHSKGPQIVANTGVWFGRGSTTGPLKAWINRHWYGYGTIVEGDLEPTPELLLLEQTRLLKQTLPPSDRLTFDFEANEVQLIGGDRILSHSLGHRDFLADVMGNATWSFVTPGPESQDVLILPAHAHRTTSEYPNMIVVFRVARDEPEVWHRMVIPLLGLELDLERMHDEGFGVFREGSQYALFLPGPNTTPLPGFNVDGRAWELHFPNESCKYMRIHLFQFPLPRE